MELLDLIKPKSKKSNSKYTEDWLPIKDIRNGRIYLENGLKVTGVKITPRNIFILDGDSQNGVLFSLKNFYNTLDYEFWIIASDRPVDITVYLSQLQLLYNSTSNPTVRKMVNEDINKANDFVNNNVVDTEYFLLFKDKDEDIIDKKVRQLIGGLSNCGLVSEQVSNEDLRVLLDGFLNGGISSDFGTVVLS